MGDNNYNSNWVICFADNLWESAQAIQMKHSDKSRLTKYPMLPTSQPLTRNSRITFVGHGNVGSTHLMGNGNQWKAEEFAELFGRVMMALGCAGVKRISFHMCYGAKPKNGTIHSSFVHKFASVCNYAEEVTGRTSETNMWIRRDGKTLAIKGGSRITYDSAGREVHQAAQSKVIYKPQGGSIGAPQNPLCYWGH